MFFKSAEASIPKYTLTETSKTLSDFKEKITSDLNELLDRHINIEKTKFINEKSCKDFYLEMQNKLVETFIALISMGLNVPLFNDDDTVEETTDAPRVAKFEEIINAASKTSVTVEVPIKLSIAIGPCEDVNCLVEKIRSLANDIVKRIVPDKMDGGTINRKIRVLTTMIHYLVSSIRLSELHT